MRPYPAELPQQRSGEADGIGVAHENGDAGDVGGRLGYVVRLPVRHHLQPVLDLPQEAVSRGQFGRGLRGDQPGAGQQPQGSESLRRAERRIAPAPDKLEGLRHELDLADAAFAQLDVVAGDASHWIAPDGQGGAPVLVDPAFHGVNVGHRREIQAAPPDERPDRLQEPPAQRQIAGHGARLDHRRAFPIQAHGFVVGDGRADRHRRRSRRRVRAQPQIGAEDVAAGVAGLHQRDQIARQAHHEPSQCVAGGPVGVDPGLRVVEQDQIHVGGIVQLARPQLPHAEDGEAGPDRGVVRVVQRQVARVVGRPQ